MVIARPFYAKYTVEVENSCLPYTYERLTTALIVRKYMMLSSTVTQGYEESSVSGDGTNISKDLSTSGYRDRDLLR